MLAERHNFEFAFGYLPRKNLFATDEFYIDKEAKSVITFSPVGSGTSGVILQEGYVLRRCFRLPDGCYKGNNRAYASAYAHIAGI